MKGEMICAACFVKFVRNDFFMDLGEIWLHNECAEELIFEAMACADISMPDLNLFFETTPKALDRIKRFAFAYWRLKFSRGDYHG